MSTELPRPVADYLAVERDKDADALALCFADGAVVHDEGRTHRGPDAIRAWKKDADAKYHYVMEPLDAAVGESGVKLRARLTGDFPGSPVELQFAFTLADDKILSLEIH